MNLSERIKSFSLLGAYILENPSALQETVYKTFLYNNWFTPENTQQSLRNIAAEFLQEEKLRDWTAGYALEDTPSNTIALVAAGNIPLVGFHDILCVLISGNRLQLKLSEKDRFLYPFLLEQLCRIEPRFTERIAIQERLGGFDAIIATGSNNTARHFEYYFSKYPNIIRRNRHSLAVLDGTETTEELQQLGHDVFDYFGLGCRNVSKIFIPREYDVRVFRDVWNDWKEPLMSHNSYRNNLDYQRTLYLMNQTLLVDIDFVNMVELPGLHSPVSCLHLERYDDMAEVQAYIQAHREQIQCVADKQGQFDQIRFGQTQSPGLADYADHVDTIDFLLRL